MIYRLRTAGRRQALLLLLAVFLLATVIRLPNLGRPLSKHHEFVDATTLIPVLAWRQAGGASTFHFIPVVNFQHPGDRRPDTTVNMDDHGNELYLSVGPGSYILAYLFFQVLHLPASPMALQVLNLLWSMLTLFICFIFFERQLPAGDDKYFKVLIACTLFLCSPCILWFTGNVYHQTALMMPIVLTTLCFTLPMFASAEKVTPTRLSAMALSLILLVYFDWFGVFLSVPIVAHALYRSGKNRSYLRLAMTAAISVTVAISLIFWQFSSYVGARKVAVYWYQRFLYRSGRSSVPDSLRMLKDVFINLGIGYAPLILFLFLTLVIRLRRKLPLSMAPDRKRFILIYACSLAGYALLLLDWSAKHDFPAVPTSLLLSFLAAVSVPPSLATRRVLTLVCITVTLSVAQYYYINRPGPVSQSGMPYDTYARFGEQLRNVNPDLAIFSNLPEYCPMCELYAGRQITISANPDSASASLTRYHLSKGVFVESSGFRFVKIDTVYPLPSTGP